MLEMLKAMWPLILLVGVMAAIAVLLKLLGIDLRAPSKRVRNSKRISAQVSETEDDLPDQPTGPVEVPYKRIDTLLSRGEHAFYRSLLIAVGTRYTIMAKVGVADLLRIEDAINAKTAFWRISQKHVDFVLCEIQTTRILAAIELDDATHDRQDRRDRDTFLDRAFDHAGLPYIHFRAATTYTPADIARQIDARLTPKTTPAPKA